LDLSRGDPAAGGARIRQITGYDAAQVLRDLEKALAAPPK
jgi:hypothetical protein